MSSQTRPIKRRATNTRPSGLPKQARKKRRYNPVDASLIKRAAGRKQAGKPYYHVSFKCFVYNGVKLRGITASLAERFYPTYRLPSGSGGAAGRVGGTAIHADLASYVTHGRAPKYVLTRSLLAAFRQWGWTLRMSEVAVASGPYGTAADLLVVDAANQPILVELKTGMKDTFELNPKHARLEHPLEAYTSCAEHHALLQALATSLMLVATYGIVARVRVVLVNDEGVRMYGDEDTAKVDAFIGALRVWLAAPVV